MDESQFLGALKPYYEAFAEHDQGRRMQLLRTALTPGAEIWGPKRVFAGYEQISEKIAGFHQNWPGRRLVLATGLNICLNSARIGGVILGPDGAARARGEALIELARDGRIQRVIPFWDALPPLPAAWPRNLQHLLIEALVRFNPSFERTRRLAASFPRASRRRAAQLGGWAS